VAHPLLYEKWNSGTAPKNFTNYREGQMNQNKKIIAVLSTLLLPFILALQANSATVHRSNFIVNKLSCTSCLATIEAELKGVPGALGMDADIRAGKVTVDHLSTLNSERQHCRNNIQINLPSRAGTVPAAQAAAVAFPVEPARRPGKLPLQQVLSAVQPCRSVTFPVLPVWPTLPLNWVNSQILMA
jgi:copper chaperone CopZ